MNQAKRGQTPLPENLNWKHAATAPSLPPSRHTAFRQIIGNPRYLTDSSRSDIQYPVNKLAEVIMPSPPNITQFSKGYSNIYGLRPPIASYTEKGATNPKAIQSRAI
eukprot:GFKZ01007931.1.p1 GENE.GFKZ01007931.1~~GFKZ01007931.1.p1  ORF type:complete len:107 (-),score=3.05 GFKZ01007931.1:33-353(-)